MRRALGLLAVGLLVFSAGCTGVFGGGSLPDSELDQPPNEPYQWDSDRDVHITVTAQASFRAVYEVPANGSSMELYRRDGFGGRNPIPVQSVRYRFPNGTTINGSQFEAYGGSIGRSDGAVQVSFPAAAEAGPNATAQFAFTSQSTAKRFSLPVYSEGSYEVVLPPDRRIDFFLFGNVVPGNYNTSIDAESRQHITWGSVTSESVLVQFYLDRDLYIFGGLLAVLSLVAVVGLVYYRRQIDELRARRREMGPDVDTGDDDFGDDGPPPGMG
jgi:hypothetical protein